MGFNKMSQKKFRDWLNEPITNHHSGGKIMKIEINRDNKITITFKNNNQLEVTDNSDTFNEIHLWFINKQDNVNEVTELNYKLK